MAIEKQKKSSGKRGRVENLKPFKPGQSGNPGGRPKGLSITARLRALLEKGEINGEPIKGGQQVADLVAESIVKQAISGNAPLIKELLDRTEGKVPDRLAGPDGETLTITLKWDDATGTYHQDALDAPGATGGPPPSGEV